MGGGHPGSSNPVPVSLPGTAGPKKAWRPRGRQAGTVPGVYPNRAYPGKQFTSLLAVALVAVLDVRRQEHCDGNTHRPVEGRGELGADFAQAELDRAGVEHRVRQRHLSHVDGSHQVAALLAARGGRISGFLTLGVHGVRRVDERLIEHDAIRPDLGDEGRPEEVVRGEAGPAKVSVRLIPFRIGETGEIRVNLGAAPGSFVEQFAQLAFIELKWRVLS